MDPQKIFNRHQNKNNQSFLSIKRKKTEVEGALSDSPLKLDAL